MRTILSFLVLASAAVSCGANNQGSKANSEQSQVHSLSGAYQDMSLLDPLVARVAAIASEEIGRRHPENSSYFVNHVLWAAALKNGDPSYQLELQLAHDEIIELHMVNVRLGLDGTLVGFNDSLMATTAH